MLPSKDNPYPHLIDEIKVAEYANSLTYDECREKFGDFWKLNQK
jgi:hypothetical protein